MSEMSKELYIVLQMACELRQVITDELPGGVPSLGIQPRCFPLPPFDGEDLEGACRRIFGDYIYTKVVQDRASHEEKRPGRYYRGFEPKGPVGGQLPLDLPKEGKEGGA